ncbi:MAG: thioredoxin family protein [Thermoanaerobaculia bacterium]
MATTDAAPVPPPRSQSRLSSILLLALLAAVLFRAVTAVMDRAEKDKGGLVQWEPREKAAALSQAAGRPILYDFTAAWCGPCKLLDRDWNDPAVAGKVNASFVPARVVDRQREEGRNSPDVSELERRYEVTGFPTLVVAAADGRMIAKHEGYRGRAALLLFLEEAKKGPGP